MKITCNLKKMKYGGNLQISLPNNGYEYESEGEYKYISLKYLNEIFSHRDEYKEMFEEYFKKYKDVQALEELKNLEIKRLKETLYWKDVECKKLREEVSLKDEGVISLNEQLAAKSKENDNLCHQLTICEAKIERAHQQKDEEEMKVKDLTKKLINMQNKNKELVTANKVLKYQVHGLEKGSMEMKHENRVKDERIKVMAAAIGELTSSKEEISSQYSVLERGNKEVVKTNKLLQQELDSNKHVFMEMQKLINLNCKSQKPKKFKFFRKKSKKALVIQELKLMLENKFINT